MATVLHEHVRGAMIAKSKLMIALLGIALLLWNPAGVCAGSPSGGGRSHPCCPASSTRHAGSTGACVCIDRQPAAPSLPSLDDGQEALLLPHIAPAQVP